MCSYYDFFIFKLKKENHLTSTSHRHGLGEIQSTIHEKSLSKNHPTALPLKAQDSFSFLWKIKKRNQLTFTRRKSLSHKFTVLFFTALNQSRERIITKVMHLFLVLFFFFFTLLNKLYYFYVIFFSFVRIFLNKSHTIFFFVTIVVAFCSWHIELI